MRLLLLALLTFDFISLSENRVGGPKIIALFSSEQKGKDYVLVGFGFGETPFIRKRMWGGMQ